MKIHRLVENTLPGRRRPREVSRLLREIEAAIGSVGEIRALGPRVVNANGKSEGKYIIRVPNGCVERLGAVLRILRDNGYKVLKHGLYGRVSYCFIPTRSTQVNIDYVDKAIDFCSPEWGLSEMQVMLYKNIGYDHDIENPRSTMWLSYTKD